MKVGHTHPKMELDMLGSVNGEHVIVDSDDLKLLLKIASAAIFLSDDIAVSKFCLDVLRRCVVELKAKGGV
jgi:hypothetical protein